MYVYSMLCEALLILIISHKFQPEVIKALTAMPRKKVEENLTDDIPLGAQERLLRQSAVIGNDFMEVFLKFADVHRGMNHSNRVTSDELCRLGKLEVI